MIKNQFVHLHVHSEYSLMNGMCRVRDIGDLAADCGMPAVALTDHGVMAGALAFYKYCNSIDVKPIVGCEVYLSPSNRFDSRGRDVFHLLLLAKNYKGYQNLCRIVSAGHDETPRKKPQIDKNILSEHAGGLICLSGCIKGEISLPILENRTDDAKKLLNEYLDIFSRENFYLELTDHGMPVQKKANKGLVSLGKEFNVKVVATNDIHYPHRKDAKAHDILRCIKNGTTVKDDSRHSFSGEEYYFKTADEMAAIFADTPEAISNTLEIAEKCNLHVPLVRDGIRDHAYEIHASTQSQDHLRQLCVEGIKTRYAFDAGGEGPFDEIQRKIIDITDYEIKALGDNRFAGYFLVVADIVRYAKDNDIPVGPGRGSAGGSMVCYLLGITDIDPIRYDLVFDRFFNSDKITPPDIDLDVCDIRRDELFEYIFNKYGRDKTAFYSVYPELRGRNLIKSILRAMGRKPSDWLKIAGNIPDATSCRCVSSAVEENPGVQELIKHEAWAKELYGNALALEGLKKDKEIHGAGITFGNIGISNVVPVYREPISKLPVAAQRVGAEAQHAPRRNDGHRQLRVCTSHFAAPSAAPALPTRFTRSFETGSRTKDKINITQYTLKECQESGLMTLDILGLKALSKIHQTVDKIKTSNKLFSIDKIPLDDKKTLDLVGTGDTDGIFQFESRGMRQICIEMGIGSIEDMIAATALYRPAPIQIVPEFIARKKGESPIEYEDSQMEPILKGTHGLIIYQEQIIKILQTLAGFPATQAEICRRALAKKNNRNAQAYHKLFVNGCADNGLTTNATECIWKKIAESATYTFNKAHSTGYSIIAYRTAFLKANYPVEFTGE